MNISNSTFIPPEASAALKEGRVGEALKLIRPLTKEHWDNGDGELPDELSAFIDACWERDRDTLSATAAA